MTPAPVISIDSHPTNPANPPKVDQVTFLLAALILFFTLVVLYCAHMFPNDGSVFQVFCSVLTGIVGALLMRIRPTSPEQGKTGPPGPAGAGGTLQSIVVEGPQQP